MEVEGQLSHHCLSYQLHLVISLHAAKMDSTSSSSLSECESDYSDEGRDSVKFYVTRESQEKLNEPSRKYSYAGHRDLSELDKIREQDIVSADGTIIGIKNRVRAGLAHFENPRALEKVATGLHAKGGGAGWARKIYNAFFSAAKGRRRQSNCVCDQLQGSKKHL